MEYVVRWFLILLFLSAVVSAELASDAHYYVSPQGSDHWSGLLATPNAQGSDGPFATLIRARDAVREYKNTTSSDIVVLIREGTYQLDKTIVFSLEDSGEGESTVTYAAYPGEKPVFSSGWEIKGWKKVTAELPGLPKVAEGKVLVADVSERFFTLYTDYNIYYSTVDPNLGKSMLATQQSDGVDIHSLAEDPLFVDPENGDFRLKPNSPTLKLGFVPIDLSKVGLQKSALDLQKVIVTHSSLKGIGMERGVMRRDPSDMINLDDLYYICYSKGKLPFIQRFYVKEAD